MRQSVTNFKCTTQIQKGITLYIGELKNFKRYLSITVTTSNLYPKTLLDEVGYITR